MMALEEQSFEKPRGSSNRITRKSAASGVTTDKANIGKDAALPLPIPPPPVHRKSPSRSPVARRSSTPCKSSASVVSGTNKTTLTLTSSTPGSNFLNVEKRNSWTIGTGCAKEDIKVNQNDFKQAQTQDKSVAEVSEESFNFAQNSAAEPQSESAPETKNHNETTTLILFSPTPQGQSRNLTNSSSHNSRSRNVSPIRLDPPPSRKSKSQSPSRLCGETSFRKSAQNIVTHTPVHVSRSVPAKKKKKEGNGNYSLKSPTKTLLNGFVSTPQTPTVTLTPTSSPPKYSMEGPFPSSNVEMNSCISLESFVLSHCRSLSPSRQARFGGFEGIQNENQSQTDWDENVPLLPPSPTKQRGSISKLLNLGENKDYGTDEMECRKLTDSDGYCSGLQLPDLPDVICSRASSSEDPESPYKLSTTPIENNELRLHPGTNLNFPLINPADLSVEELREFAMKWGSPHHAPSSHTMLLAIPPPTGTRPRVTSLPAPVIEPPVGDDESIEEYYRLRHFSIIGRGIVNRGDSIKTRRSKSSTCPLQSSEVSQIKEASSEMQRGVLSPTAPPCITLSCDDVSKMHCLDGLIQQMNESGVARNNKWRDAWSNPCSLATSAASSVASSRASSTSENPFPFRVVVIGGPGVGKTSLCHQFMTSEHINAYDNSLDDEFGEQSISVMLDGEESEIQFVDHPADEMSVENFMSTYEPHAMVIVYSVIDDTSFVRAEEILQYLWKIDFCAKKGVILVANKTDLVRNRCVFTKDGSQLAASYDCKYIETSSALNHRVDELLVGILKQIRLKVHNLLTNKDSISSKRRRSGRKKLRGRKTSASVKVKSFLTKVCGKEAKSKSCENLLVL